MMGGNITFDVHFLPTWVASLGDLSSPVALTYT